MLKNYLLVAVRSIVRHKYFSAINATGLALGMSFSLLLLSFYSYISSFDDFHSKQERIYRIITTLDSGIDKKDYASAPSALAIRLQNEVQGIDAVVRVQASFHGNVVTDKATIPVDGYYADSNFFSVFDFDLLEGDPLHALTKSNSIVLTESVAQKFAPSGDLVGTTLEIEGLGSFQVTGVVKDQRRTHLWFEALVSFNTLSAKIRGEESDAGQWTRFTDQYVYALVNEHADRGKLQLALDRISEDVNNLSEDAQINFTLQALGDITPGPDLENSTGGDTDYTLIVVLATICLLILLPACFNYATISIARALKRSKEVGLRKTLGGTKTVVFFQFVTETIVVVLVALMSAFVIFLIIRPEFEDMMPGAWLDLSLTWQMVLMFLVFALVTGFLTGIVPALHFAGLNPIQALKGKVTTGGSSRMRVRRLLITFQFALSFCFIVLLVVFSRQYRYTLNFNYGFNADNILDVQLQDVRPDLFTTEVSRLHEVQDVSLSSDILGLSYSSTFVRTPERSDSVKVFQMFADARYVENLGLKLIAGKGFPEIPRHDERYVLVNETFLSTWQVASPAEALGRTFIVDGKELEVIGVLKDFHYAPLQEPIESFFIRTDPSQYKYANLKVASNDMHSTIASMDKVWTALSGKKFEAHFMDDEIEAAYQFYESLVKMIGWLGLVAVWITLLGLLGMVIYSIESRTKEVGIRKVHGAGEAALTYLLSKDFLKLMAWGLVFAIPAIALLVDDFLALLQYYRVSLNVWDILISLGIVVLIGVGTTISQTWRAARTNPVTVLRHE